MEDCAHAHALVTTHCVRVVGDGVEAFNPYRVVPAIAEGRVPPASRPFFAGGRLVGLRKPNINGSTVDTPYSDWGVPSVSHRAGAGRPEEGGHGAPLCP